MIIKIVSEVQKYVLWNDGMCVLVLVFVETLKALQVSMEECILHGTNSQPCFFL